MKFDDLKQKLAPAFFFGFIQSRLPALHFIATAEKALLDFIYLSIPRSQKLDLDLFLSGYRLQNLDRLNKKKLKQTLTLFQAPRVQQGGKLILDYLRRKNDWSTPQILSSTKFTNPLIFSTNNLQIR